MIKKLTTVLAVAMLFAYTAKAQWTSAGAWPNDSYVGGSHGIAVDPDGKVWTAGFFPIAYVSGSDTTNYYPIFVFNADGSLVDSINIVTDGTTSDSLLSGIRGLTKDNEGNILVVHSGPNKLIKINYQTMERINSVLIPEVGSSPTKPAVSSDGTIYIGPVVGGGTTAIATYGSDLAYGGNAVDGPPAISRTLEVSADGLTIYWTPFTAQQMFIYKRADLFSSFELVDSALAGMSIETAEWNPATGLLWVSNDSRGTGPYTHLTWYGFDPSTKALVDSFTLASPLPTAVDEYPRALEFSDDGNVAYVGLFGSTYARAYKFDKVTGIEQELGVKPDNFSLSQNFPNPFNPSTTIKFKISNPGFVTLKVYDMLGREVAQLVNQDMTSGSYSINFDASNLASGTYVYQLNAGDIQLSKKMVLLK